jgi:hypothetical protein
MSASTLSAAIKAIQPGISTAPDAAMASWTVIKNFPDMVSPFMRTSFLWAASSTALIGFSVFTTLVLARIPSTQTSPASDSSLRWRLINAASSALLTFVAYSRSTFATINSVAGCILLSTKISQTITDLKPGMIAPSETTLEGWVFLKHFVTTIPAFTASMQRSFMWTALIASLAFAATFIAINSQKEDHTQTKKRLDNIALGSLGLATVASLCGYIYTRTYAPIIS